MCFKKTYLCRFVELLRRDSKRSGSLQVPLSFRELGSGHHLHGLGDLLDVLDGLQPHGNNLQIRHLAGFFLMLSENKVM